MKRNLCFCLDYFFYLFIHVLIEVHECDLLASLTCFYTYSPALFVGFWTWLTNFECKSKLSLREVKWFPQDHTASKGQVTACMVPSTRCYTCCPWDLIRLGAEPHSTPISGSSVLSFGSSGLHLSTLCYPHWSEEVKCEKAENYKPKNYLKMQNTEKNQFGFTGPWV